MSKQTGSIAYCGLDCTECINRKGEIADMARDLRKKLRKEKFAKMAPGLAKYLKPLNDYNVCYVVLGAMVRLRCNRNCSDGGGNSFCKVRICCRKKEIEGCWECDELESCRKLDFLKPIHEDIHLKTIQKLRKKTVNKVSTVKMNY
jgi:hypothetical protein